MSGLAGLLATRQLYQLEGAIEIIGSRKTVAFARRYLSTMIGTEHEAGYRLCSVYALVIEATFLERDAALARSLPRASHCRCRAARQAREADIGELLLTHISGRYKAEEILAEAAGLFPRVRVAADFDRVSVAARVSS
jgi:hypothetical protein